MKFFVEELCQKVLSGVEISPEEAYKLIAVDPTGEEASIIRATAHALRLKYFKADVDLCSIVNVKSGKCTEDCQFCAQSAYYKTQIEIYPILSESEVLDRAKMMAGHGVHRYSMVSSGRGPEEEALEAYCHYYKQLNQQVQIGLCASHGIIDRNQASRLREAGVKRYHHNLETSETYYEKICTTHSYADRIETIRSAQAEGLEVCSGGIFGLGETLKDRVDLAYTLKMLEVDCIPLNILNPIPKTPLADVKLVTPEEILLSIAVFRLILPKTSIRVAGGRALLEERQWQVLNSGADGLMVGNYLTTQGGSIEADFEAIEQLGLKR